MHAINVIVIFVLLRFILWKPVTRFLAQRAAHVKAELDSAAEAKRSAEEMKAEYEQHVADFEEQGREILRDSQVRAGEQANTMLAGAKDKAEQIVTEARSRAEEERRQAVSNAQRDVAAMAAAMAARILRREVNPEDDVAAAMEFFEPEDADTESALPQSTQE
jgi:F-type H+-transporting ATPase subunit b